MGSEMCIRDSVGTMRTNKKKIPAVISDAKNRQVSSSVHVYKAEAVLVSYMPKAGKNSKYIVYF